MTKNLFILLALLGLTPPALAQEPKEIAAQFHSAMSRGDSAAVIGMLSPHVVIYESGFIERSRAEYAAHHLPEDIKFAQQSELKVRSIEEHRSGDFSVIMEETETKAKKNGKPVFYAGTGTLLLEKTDGVWLITHIHWSSRKK